MAAGDFWQSMPRRRWLAGLCFGAPAAFWFLVGLETGSWLPFLIGMALIAAGSFLIWLMRPIKPGDR